MRQKSVVLLALIVLLISCQSKSNVINEEFTEVSKFTTFLRGYNGTREIDITAAEEGFYIAQEGGIYFFDFKTKEKIKIFHTDYIDDQENYGEYDYKKYSEKNNKLFLSYYDEHLYYISNYHSIEGENINYLNQVEKDGSNSKRILEMEISGHNHQLIKGRLFFIDDVTQEMIDYDINTGTFTKQHFDPQYSFLKFSSSGKELIANFVNDNSGANTAFKYNFDTQVFEELFEFSGGIIDIHDDKMLLHNYNSETDTFYGEVINFDGDSILQVMDETRYMNYIDDRFVYTSSRVSPQEYLVYDYSGDVVERYEALERFVINPEERLLTSNDYLELSQIQGVNDDYLLVIGTTEEGVVFSLIDRKTREWFDLEI